MFSFDIASPSLFGLDIFDGWPYLWLLWNTNIRNLMLLAKASILHLYLYTFVCINHCVHVQICKLSLCTYKF